jgi:crotonobetainyl-CoA:carnitine CoA-transferase CaiB-like acyl-CoA transferase
MRMSPNEKPLAGVKVLDLSRLLPAPFTTMVLADLGAQVDKLEDPKGGDFARVTPPHAADGMGVMFHWINRGKRSLVLDLKEPAGREAFLRLLPSYDVLVEGNRPGVMDRLGLGYEALREVHPRLVYCAVTGYGQDGPLRDRAGHDLNYIGRAGVLGMTGPESGPPQVPGVQMADVGGGLFATIGILAALAARAQTGEGRFVDISMAEAAISLGLFGFSSHFGGFPVDGGKGALMGAIAPYSTYLTKDGRAVSLGALEPKFWSSFCKGTGLEESPMAQFPGPHQAEWKAKVAAIIGARTRDEWVAFNEAHDCCLEPILTPDETFEDPQHVARGVWVERPTQDGGKVRMARTPVAPAAEGVAPRQGEHTDAILREHGFSDDEIAALRAARGTR